MKEKNAKVPTQFKNSFAKIVGTFSGSSYLVYCNKKQNVSIKIKTHLKRTEPDVAFLVLDGLKLLRQH